MIRRLAVAGSVLFAASGFAPPASAQDHSLSVEVTGARSDAGVLIVCLWRQGNADDFPKCISGGTVQSRAAPISNGRATTIFDGLPAGRYAVSALHDENSDGRMNRAFMRPSEGLALSRNERIEMPPPGFAEADFELVTDQSITLTVYYW